ncbi:MAG: hypothetical protein MZU95_05095 [Desulfomicrobium escambiense]|nr:hypothetical protein [Desulfomicrobium escambiense]
MTHSSRPSAKWSRSAGGPHSRARLSSEDVGEQNWWKRRDAVECLEEARRSGVQVTCDRYPYVAASTDLDTVLPSWAYEGGTDEELRRLTDPSTRKEILAEVQPEGSPYWKNVVVSSVTTEARGSDGRHELSPTSPGQRKSLCTLPSLTSSWRRGPGSAPSSFP